MSVGCTIFCTNTLETCGTEQMADVKVMLSKRQIAYIIEITEIKDQNEAIKYFGNLVILEGMKASDMGRVVDKLMKKKQ